jgi:zinc D-Ala-D-Ala carboxypeptidase
VTKNKKWLMLGGLFATALAIIIGLGSKTSVISANQIPEQARTPSISPVKAMTEGEKDRLVKIATNPFPTSTAIAPKIIDAAPVASIPTQTSTELVAIPQNGLLASDEPYREAIPANNSASRKYHSIALQTGYIETYPQLDSSIMGSSNGQTIVQDALDAFNTMRRSAAQDGISLKVLSGFRTIKTQIGIFDARKGGGISAAQFSAPPGHSQHHTGLALDLNSLSPSFRGTPAYLWLKKHAPSYGFMLSFENSQGDLGPKNEPWHWVYVKDPRAMKLMSCFITRAKSIGYDPLQGDAKLTTLHQSIAKNAACAS